MEFLGLGWIPDCLVWWGLTAVLLYMYGTWPYSTLSAYGYRGPKPKPFIGNVDLVFTQGHFGSWDLKGKQLYGKVFSMYEGRQPTLVIFDTDLLKHVMVKDFSNFTNRRFLPLRGDFFKHAMTDLTDDSWRRVRNLSTPVFSTGKLKQNIESLATCCGNLKRRCKSLAANKEALDAKEVLSAFTMEVICQTAFGLAIDSQANPDHVILRTAQAVAGAFVDMPKNFFFLSGFVFPPLYTLYEKLGYDMWPPNSVQTLRELTKVAIEDRQRSRKTRNDFIQAMIKAHEEHELEEDSQSQSNHNKAMTDDEIAAQVAVFLLAGYDTTATTISFLLLNLADNPDCQARLVDEIREVIGDGAMTYDNLKEMQYLDMCLEETLRLYPAVFRSDRRCDKDITINDYFIPEGTLVEIPIYGLHHDPEYWDDPETFNPERFSPDNRRTIHPYTFLPFGGGPRNCIGMRLAQIEVKMAVITIIRAFHVSVSARTKMPVELAVAIQPVVKGGLYLDLVKRQG